MKQFYMTRREAVAMLAVAVPQMSFADQPGVGDCTLVFDDSIIHQQPDHLIVRHAFSAQALIDTQTDPDGGVIVHHGAPVGIDGFRSVYSHTETLPVYWNAQSGVRDLSNEVVSKIMSGAITNWAQAGGNDIPVTVYAPVEPLKEQALSKQIESATFQAKSQSWKKGDYQFQAQGVSQDAGGIALGLRSAAAKFSDGQKVQQWTPCHQDGSLTFKVPMFVYVRDDSAEATAAAIDLMSTTARRAQEDGKVFPLEDFMQRLSSE